MKKYLSEYPELVSEWHPTKNTHLNHQKNILMVLENWFGGNVLRVMTMSGNYQFQTELDQLDVHFVLGKEQQRLITYSLITHNLQVNGIQLKMEIKNQKTSLHILVRRYGGSVLKIKTMNFRQISEIETAKLEVGVDYVIQKGK